MSWIKPPSRVGMSIICSANKVVDLYEVTGSCRNCGGCCGRVLPLSDREVRRMRMYSKTKHGFPFNDFEVSCPFMKMDGSCSIYSNRPRICRIYNCHDHKTLKLFERESIAELADMVPFDLRSLI